MKLRSSLFTCLLFAALAAPAFAAPGDTSDRQALQAERAQEKRARKAAKAERNQAKAVTKRYQLPAEELRANIAKLQTELSWHDDLEEARQAAIEANKPILWIQALGDLSGLL